VADSQSVGIIAEGIYRWPGQVQRLLELPRHQVLRLRTEGGLVVRGAGCRRVVFGRDVLAAAERTWPVASTRREDGPNAQ
jgi:hypothetical protein